VQKSQEKKNRSATCAPPTHKRRGEVGDKKSDSLGKKVPNLREKGEDFVKKGGAYTGFSTSPKGKKKRLLGKKEKDPGIDRKRKKGG